MKNRSGCRSGCRLGCACGCLFPLLLGLLIFECWTFFLYFDRYKRYYIPEVDMYLTLYTPPLSMDGYVMLSRNGSSCFSDSVDYIKHKKKETCGFKLIFNPLDRSNDVVITGWCDVKGIRTKYFKMEETTRPDTFFVETNAIRYELRDPYIAVCIEDRLDSASLWGERGTLIPID